MEWPVWRNERNCHCYTTVGKQRAGTQAGSPKSLSISINWMDHGGLIQQREKCVVSKENRNVKLDF